jgi:pteridine reductase
VGRAIVERLADAGFDVAFTYLTSQAEAIKLKKRVALRGRRIVAIRADLREPERAVQQLRDEFARAFKRLDVLVNSASIYRAATLRQTTPRIVRELMAVHIEAPLLLCQVFEPMLRRARGRVINMCDFLGQRPWPKYLPYSASKAALANLTLGLARELAPEVNVNGIAPGVVAWPKAFPRSRRATYLKRVPLGREGTPEDVAELVHFLATDASYITGQIIRLDGGRSIT